MCIRDKHNTSKIVFIFPPMNFSAKIYLPVSYTHLAPLDTLAMLSEIRSNLSMFQTSFDLAYLNIFLPDEHMASSESLYFFPMSKLSDFQIPKEVLENPGTSSVWFYQDLLSLSLIHIYITGNKLKS